MNIFKKIKKLEHGHLLEIAGLSAAAMILIFAAVFIGSGGMARIGHSLAVNGISPRSLTANVFPCSWFNECSAATQVYYGLTANTTSVSSGGAVTLNWLAYGTSSGTSFASCWIGNSYTCSLTGVGNVGTQCVYQPASSVTSCVTDPKWGTQTCTTTTTPANPCSNFGANQGAGSGSAVVYPSVTTTYNFCGTYYFGTHDGSNFGWYSFPAPCPSVTVNVAVPPVATTISSFYASPASPAYNTSTSLHWTGTHGANFSNCYVQGGQWGTTWTSVGDVTSGTVTTNPLTSPANYYLYCYDSYYGNVYSNPYPLTVTPGNAPVTADATPATQTVTVGQSATIYFHADSVQPPSQCQVNNSDDTLALKNVAGCPTSANASYTTPVYTTAGTYAYKFYYYQSTPWVFVKTVTVVVNPGPPIPTISASPTTVNANGTSQLSWSATQIANGSCSLTAPSYSSVATNFASVTSGAGAVLYHASFVTAGGYVYQFGGRDNTTWYNLMWRIPAGSDLTVAGPNWTSLGSMPTAAVYFDQPLVINGVLYFFGGYNVATASYTSTICSVPVGSIATASAWDCSHSLPSGGAQAYVDPVIIGDYIYKFNGYNATAGVGLTSVERAPVSSPYTWTNYAGVLPQHLYQVQDVIAGNYVYLLGGYSTDTSAAVNSIYRALLSSDLTQAASWSSVGVLPSGMYGHVTVVDGSNLYLIGGYNGSSYLSTIYKIPLGTLAAGGITAGSWSLAATFPTSIYLTVPVISNAQLFLMGGYTAGTTYVSKVYAMPFNDGLPYTTPANLPWHTTGNNNVATTWPITANSTTYTLQCTNTLIAAVTKQVFLTTTGGGSWTVPADWNPANNTVEVLGGGGGSPTSPAGQSSGGGGGAAYAKVSNVSLTPNSVVSYSVGVGANPGPVGGTGGPGGDSYFCNSSSNCSSIAGSAVIVGAKGGNGANYNGGGAGGSAAASVGTVKYSGGTGGNGVHGGGGGGGAAGPLGNGGNGGQGGSGTYGYTGGSGGGNGGGSIGGDGGPFTSGNGGNNAQGTGGAAGASFPSSGNNGTSGGGGGGGAGVYGHTSAGYTNGYGGGNGSTGTEWGSTYGSGGGGGGGGGGAVNGSGLWGGPGGGYGAGAGGPGMGGAGGWGGTGGSQGIIVITYTPAVTTQTGTATATVTEPDLCTNAPFTGIQNPIPANSTAVGTTCTCNSSTLWNGSICGPPVPVINTPSISTLLTTSLTAVKRVKKNNQVVLNWSVTGLTPNDINTSCSVSSFPASAMTPITLDGSTNTLTTWTQGATPPAVTITGSTIFTVSCTNPGWNPSTFAASATVNLVPSFQEQ